MGWLCSLLLALLLQEKAAQKAREAKAKAELDAARRVAEEMGMGNVGKADGIRLAAHRIKRKVVGSKVRHMGSCSSLRTVNVITLVAGFGVSCLEGGV